MKRFGLMETADQNGGEVRRFLYMIAQLLGQRITWTQVGSLDTLLVAGLLTGMMVA